MCVLADTIGNWEFGIILVVALLIVLIAESR